MIVEKIERKKNNVFLVADGKEYVVDEDVVLMFRLKEGVELDDGTLADVVTQSEEALCKKYLYAQIDRYSKTEKGYRDKLYQKGFSKRAITVAIGKAKELGYIDDGAYAQRYYERNKDKKGVARIKNELRAKGVPSSLLDFLREEETDDETVLTLAEKFMRKREKTPEERVKLMRHLAAKGFSYDVIVRVTNKYFHADWE